MNWSRITCAVLGHKLVYVKAKPGYMEFGVGRPHRCMRCDYEWEGLRYPPIPPRPTPPPPPPPPPPPRKLNDARRLNDRDGITLKVELDGLEAAKAEVASLHAQWTEVLKMREEAMKPVAAGCAGQCKVDPA